jgi:hypothetical protein
MIQLEMIEFLVFSQIIYINICIKGWNFIEIIFSMSRVVEKKKGRKRKKGRGLLNKIIDKLPFELHLPGYQYCGPGTKLQKRLARGDPGINSLDRACREHDIAYSSKDPQAREEADRILHQQSKEIYKNPSNSIGERANSWLVSKAMKIKTKLGMGVSKKKTERREQRRITKQN